MTSQALAQFSSLLFAIRPRVADARSRRAPRHGQVVGAVCIAACTGAWAAESDFGSQAIALATTPGKTAPAFEYSSASYPSLPSPGVLDGQPAGLSTTATAAGYGGTLQSHTLTHWMTPERPRSLGVSLGLSSLTTPAALAPGMASAPLGLDMGVRWRSQLDTRRQLDVAAWARAPQNAHTPDAMQLIWLAQQPSFGTRVEMQWSSSRTGGLVPEFGAIGMQLRAAPSSCCAPSAASPCCITARSSDRASGRLWPPALLNQ